MFTLFKERFQKIYQSLSKKLSGLFAHSIIDQATIKQLEQLLLEADIGVSATQEIVNTVQKAATKETLSGKALQTLIQTTLLGMLKPWHPKTDGVIMLVGINGSGKTTAAAKLAARYKKADKKVLLVAADTFRAAAVQQLESWAKTLEIPLVIPAQPEAAPGSVIFNGCKTYIEQQYDVVIIDTAGRLQTKTHLMQELEKLRKIILKFVKEEKLTTLLTVDSMLGQSSFDQAALFHECTPLDGIILTKMDGTAKGGIVFAIAQKLNIPVAYVSAGEKIEDLMPFDANAYIDTIMGDDHS